MLLFELVGGRTCGDYDIEEWRREKWTGVATREFEGWEAREMGAEGVIYVGLC